LFYKKTIPVESAGVGRAPVDNVNNLLLISKALIYKEQTENRAMEAEDFIRDYIYDADETVRSIANTMHPAAPEERCGGSSVEPRFR
jgi:hypothetical protein